MRILLFSMGGYRRNDKLEQSIRTRGSGFRILERNLSVKKSSNQFPVQTSRQSDIVIHVSGRAHGLLFHHPVPDVSAADLGRFSSSQVTEVSPLSFGEDLIFPLNFLSVQVQPKIWIGSAVCPFGQMKRLLECWTLLRTRLCGSLRYGKPGLILWANYLPTVSSIPSSCSKWKERLRCPFGNMP